MLILGEKNHHLRRFHQVLSIEFLRHVPFSSLVWRSSGDPGVRDSFSAYSQLETVSGLHWTLVFSEVVYYLFVVANVNYQSKSVRCSVKEGCWGVWKEGIQLPPVLCPLTSLYPQLSVWLVQSGPLFAPRSGRGGAAHLVKSCPYYSLTDLNIVK